MTGRGGGRRQEVVPSLCGVEGDPCSGTAPAVTQLCRERAFAGGLGLGRRAGQNKGPSGLSAPLLPPGALNNS